MMDLFTTRADLQITRITPLDVEWQTDLLELFTASICKHEVMYPSISKWVKEKVIPGIRNNSRIAYLGFCNDLPVVTAVIKKDHSTKFCHLHLDESIQDTHLGELFFSLMVIDVRHIADSIHFTLPESLWAREQNFFKSFGFESIQKAPAQYRAQDEELICKSSFDRVWESTIEKLPKIIDLHSIDQQNVSNGLLMSIKPHHMQKILNGDKVVEIRKRFNHKWRKRRVTLYSTHPIKAVVGYAVIHNVINDTPENVWENYGQDLGCSKNEFYSYAEGLSTVYAIQLEQIQPYKSPVPITQLSWFLDQALTPPQSYASLKENRTWLSAISIADILQRRFSTLSPVV